MNKAEFNKMWQMAVGYGIINDDDTFVLTNSFKKTLAREAAILAADVRNKDLNDNEFWDSILIMAITAHSGGIDYNELEQLHEFFTVGLNDLKAPLLKIRHSKEK